MYFILSLLQLYFNRVCIPFQTVASSSSVPKSTSSMTLPVSSPSSHSQFDEATGAHVPPPRITGPDIHHHHSHSLAPQHIEQRLDYLSRYIYNAA